MTRYDYSSMTGDTELAEIVDGLNNWEIGQVSEMVKAFRLNEDQRRQKERKKCLFDVVIAILKDFAETTDSVLDVEQNPDGEALRACLMNDVGFYAVDRTSGLRLAIQLADHMGIDSENGSVRVHLDYS